MNPWHSEIALRARFQCEYCRAPEAAANLAFEVEHIVPRSRGGADDSGNFALACRSCNLHKGDSIAGVAGELVPLYHPRRDTWSDHFTIDRETGEIVGKTAIGRATVARLRMNSAYQIAARTLWIRLELI